MATTATNKQPLLIDSPLCRIRRLDGTSSPVGTVDPGTGSNGVLLVDCTSNEGALIEHVWLIQRVANNQTAVNLYLSSSNLALGVTVTGGQADSFFLTQGQLGSNSPIGATGSFPLPLLLSPVPHAAVGVSAGYVIPQFRGLRLERGEALWAAADVVTPDPDAPSIGVQGGFY